MTVEEVAKICHEANKALCETLGDNSQYLWAYSPDWQKETVIAGVNFHLDNPYATPKDSHESWMAKKEADGWKYGEVKDADKKEHPCFRPYSELPPEQQAKDYLFRAIIHALARFVEAPVNARLEKEYVDEALQDFRAELEVKRQELAKRDTVMLFHGYPIEEFDRESLLYVAYSLMEKE